MIDTCASGVRFMTADLAPHNGSSARQEQVSPMLPRVRRFVSGAAIGAAFILPAATGDVRWSELPGRGLTQPSSVMGIGSFFSGASLRALADTALARMDRERRALFEEIASIRADFGEPVDVNALVREIREDAS